MARLHDLLIFGCIFPCNAPFPVYPFQLWDEVLPFRSQKGIGSVTMGLTAFAGREVEFETSRRALGP